MVTSLMAQYEDFHMRSEAAVSHIDSEEALVVALAEIKGPAVEWGEFQQWAFDSYSVSVVGDENVDDL